MGLLGLLGFLIDFFAILIVHTWPRCRLSWLEMGTRAFPEIPVFGETTVLCNFEGSEMPKGKGRARDSICSSCREVCSNARSPCNRALS